MSGGTLCNIYYLEDWAEQMKTLNPILSHMFHDLYDLMDKYDYYLSGDSDLDEAEIKWKEIVDKYFAPPMNEVITKTIMEDLESTITHLLARNVKQ